MLKSRNSLVVPLGRGSVERPGRVADRPHCVKLSTSMSILVKPLWYTSTLRSPNTFTAIDFPLKITMLF